MQVRFFVRWECHKHPEMFSMEIPQAPWNVLDREAYCEFRAPYHKRALQLCPGSCQKRARILISTCTSGILWSFTDFVFVRFLRQGGHGLYRGPRVVSTIPVCIVFHPRWKNCYLIIFVFRTKWFFWIWMNIICWCIICLNTNTFISYVFCLNALFFVYIFNIHLIFFNHHICFLLRLLYLYLYVPYSILHCNVILNWS